MRLQRIAGNRFTTKLLGRLNDSRPIDEGVATDLGPGRNLGADDRAWLEKASGPLPAISLHDGPEAGRLLVGAGAQAAAIGSSVALPAHGHSGWSRRTLLAHEVAHVLQQRAAHLPHGDVNTLEREADGFASSAVSGNAFRIQHSAPVGWAFKKEAMTTAAPGVVAQAQSTADTSLEGALKNLPKLAPDEALAVLKRFQKFIIGRISNGEGRIRSLMALRAESFGNYLIGGTIEVFGGTSLPSDDWREPWQHVNAAYDPIAKRQVKQSLDHLLSAAAATSQQWEKLNEYLEQTEKGTDRSILALQVLQAAGAVAATALTGGGAAAVAAGAGYAATTNLAGQVTAVSIGIQDRIDWAGLAFDTIFGALTGALGGKLGNAVLKRLLGNKAVASLGRRVLSEVVSDLVSGRLSSILHTAGRSLFDQLRGRENLTMEQFIERLADQLMDPKAMLLDAITGRASKMAHAKAAKKESAPSDKSTAEPRVAKTPAPEPEVVKAPEPEVVKAPEPEVVKAPEPEVVKAPEPEVVKAVEPEVVKAVEPVAPEPKVKGPNEPADLGRGAGLTQGQTAAAKSLIGKPLTSGESGLGALWEGVSNAGEKANLTKSNSRRLFNNQRKRFWKAVFDNPAARAFFENAGCKFGKRGNAPVLELPGGETLQMTIDHITERQQDPSKTLDASNLQISSRRENTVVLRQLHDQDPFQNPQRHGWDPY